MSLAAVLLEVRKMKWGQHELWSLRAHELVHAGCDTLTAATSAIAWVRRLPEGAFHV